MELVSSGSWEIDTLPLFLLLPCSVIAISSLRPLGLGEPRWMVAVIAVEVTVPRSSPDSIVCVLQGNMGLPGLAGNPGPLGRKVGLVLFLTLPMDLLASFTFKQKHHKPPVPPSCSWIPWAQNSWAREEGFLNPECPGVGSPLM